MASWCLVHSCFSCHGASTTQYLTFHRMTTLQLLVHYDDDWAFAEGLITNVGASLHAVYSCWWSSLLTTTELTGYDKYDIWQVHHLALSFVNWPNLHRLQLLRSWYIINVWRGFRIRMSFHQSINHWAAHGFMWLSHNYALFVVQTEFGSLNSDHNSLV